MTAISRLLKSCATPPVSWPMVSSFCDCRSVASVRFSSVTSRASATTCSTRAASSRTGFKEKSNVLAWPSGKTSATSRRISSPVAARGSSARSRSASAGVPAHHGASHSTLPGRVGQARPRRARCGWRPRSGRPGRAASPSGRRCRTRPGTGARSPPAPPSALRPGRSGPARCRLRSVVSRDTPISLAGRPAVVLHDPRPDLGPVHAAVGPDGPVLRLVVAPGRDRAGHGLLHRRPVVRVHGSLHLLVGERVVAGQAEDGLAPLGAGRAPRSRGRAPRSPAGPP